MSQSWPSPARPSEVFVHFLPGLIEPAALKGGIAVVIDVLRASTTIVHALAAGAEAVIPCEEVEKARAVAANLPPGTALLGGERAGLLIEGFDLDNSPARYTPEAVAGKTLVFTTTNGTRALQRAATAERILVGAFANIDALVAALAAGSRPIHLVCAGTGGRITAEDCLFAGAVASALADLAESAQKTSWKDDQTQIAVDFFRARNQSRETFLEALYASQGGQDLVQLGLQADIDQAANWNTTLLVPEFSPNTGRIERLNPEVRRAEGKGRRAESREQRAESRES